MKRILVLFVCAFLIGSTSAAKTNEQIAAERLIERYPETHVLPSTGLGIFYGESGGGHNNGRYYGNMARRIYDIKDSTDQFLDLMLKYGNVGCQKSWMSQLYVIQSHGYYGGTQDYIGYVTRIIEMHDFSKYDERAKRYEKKVIRKRRRKERERIQSGRFILCYDPQLLPWQVRTYKGAISGGTIRIRSDHEQWAWLDVVEVKKGKRAVIYIGDLYRVMLHPVVTLAEVLEEAKG